MSASKSSPPSSMSGTHGLFETMLKRGVVESSREFIESIIQSWTIVAKTFCQHRSIVLSPMGFRGTRQEVRTSVVAGKTRPAKQREWAYDASFLVLHENVNLNNNAILPSHLPTFYISRSNCFLNHSLLFELEDNMQGLSLLASN